MWPIDFPTLVLILAAGLELGSQGFFRFSFFGWLFGSWKTWQLCRQRFR